uniref:LAGLIDADG homing endonuclease n=1 Tax=Hydrocytium acuminatum TaxID=1745963 RepID=UPI002A7F1A9C|nr:LAGLIDADG homing endonuclease [Hydrocytium acuminatum]WOR09572.1 LAGLIDADG homing endonuclease [Hydrocytium acuminatum]
MIKQKVILKPGHPIPSEILLRIKEVNERYSKTKNFNQYLTDLKAIFQIDQEPLIKKESKIFLAGFLEGEASLNVSAKKLGTVKFGLLLDPEFSITQHLNGFAMLYLALKVFRAGRIRYKSGSLATLVFVIDNRRTLEEKVIPFYKKYVVPYGSNQKIERLTKFENLISLFNKDFHHQYDSFINEMLPIWDEMRNQKGQSNESFASLQEARSFVRDFLTKKITENQE